MTTSTLTVTEFVLARIAEDEAAAREAWPNDWVCDGNSVTSRDPDPRESYLGDRTQVARLAMTIGKYQREAANAEHIARHDPARVLAQCAAMRKIVECHVPIDEKPDGWCTLCDGDGWPCLTMGALASIWSDHPQFNSAWA